MRLGGDLPVVLVPLPRAVMVRAREGDWLHPAVVAVAVAVMVE